MPVAAHRDGRRPYRAAEVEGKYLAALITAELQRHQSEQDRLAGAGRTNDQRVADISNMEREPERGRAFGLGEEQRGCTEVLVPFRPRPHRRERNDMGEIEGGDRRLPDIGVDMAGQGAEPGLDRVHGLIEAGEVAALNHLLDQPQLFVGGARVGVPHGDGRGDVGLADHVAAEFLQRRVSIGGLVRRVRIEQRRGLVGHHLFEDGRD